MQETWVQSLCQEDPLEEEMSNHSSILVCKIPWQRILVGYSPWVAKDRHDLATKPQTNTKKMVVLTFKAIDIDFKECYLLYNKGIDTQSSSFFKLSQNVGYNVIESEICSVVSNSLQLHGLYSPWNSLGQNTGVGSLSLLQGIGPTQWIKSRSPALQVDSLQTELSGKPIVLLILSNI